MKIPKNLKKKQAVLLIVSTLAITIIKSQNTSYNQNSVPIQGANNCALGNEALFQSNGFSYNNVAIGNSAMWNSRGNNNTAIGISALYNNAILGNYNTALGANAFMNNNAGAFNTGVGANTSLLSSTLNNATAIGYGAIVNSSNTIQLGNADVLNVFVGVANNATLTTGGLQVTGGFPATGKILTSDMFGNATWQFPSNTNSWLLNGNSNTIDGVNFIGTIDNVPLNFRTNNITSGKIDFSLKNSFYGVYAGQSNSTGFGNSAIGYGSLPNNSTGEYNCAFGGSALHSNTIGVSNCAFGVGAMSNNQTGSLNTCIGFESNVNAQNLKNSTAIGAGAMVNRENKVRIGDINIEVIEGAVDFSFPSDGRFKYNVSQTDVKGLEFINRLNPIVYNFDTKAFQNFLVQKMSDSLRNIYLSKKDFQKSSSIRQSGFIAQEVEKAAIESGYDFNGVKKPKSDQDNYGISYSLLTVPLVKSVQELSTELNKYITATIANEEEILILKKEVNELRELLKTLISSNPLVGK